jgi:hypothetical protein
VLRLAGAVLLEVHDEWAIAERRYLAEGSTARLDPTAGSRHHRRATVAQR